MSGAESTDPHGRLESLGYKGTNTTEEASGGVVVSSSGEVEVKGLGLGNDWWVTSGFESSDMEGFVDESARMRYRIGKVEREIAQFQQVHRQMQQAQQAVGKKDLYSLLRTIGTVQDDVADLRAQIEAFQPQITEGTSPRNVEQPDGAKAMGESKSAGMYIKLSQIVFVGLGILSIYLALTLQSGPWPILTTFAVPILFILAFAGVIAERSQLQISHGNNVS